MNLAVQFSLFLIIFVTNSHIRYNIAEIVEPKMVKSIGKVKSNMIFPKFTRLNKSFYRLKESFAKSRLRND